jgi:hypothetical protein
MGALIAGVTLSAQPYTIDVVAKIRGLRDFFVTLFFVALGMQIPIPSVQVVGLALLATVVLLASRLIVVFPILRAMRLGHRASLLPAINLAQMSEFSMAIAAIGVGYGHIDQKTVSVLMFVFALTSVSSTYLIGYSHALQERLNGVLRRMGLRDLDSGPADTPSRTRSGKDVVLLGFFTEASALVHEYEILDSESILQRLLVIDFNPQVHAELVKRGIACRYGDVSNMETLHHADVHDAKLVVSTIPDNILKGTSNMRLLKQVRRLCPHARVIVTANRAGAALALYDAGADYVFVPHLHSSAQRAAMLEEGLAAGFDHLRAAHIDQLRQRDEVIK